MAKRNGARKPDDDAWERLRGIEYMRMDKANPRYLIIPVREVGDHGFPDFARLTVDGHTEYYRVLLSDLRTSAIGIPEGAFPHLGPRVPPRGAVPATASRGAYDRYRHGSGSWRRLEWVQTALTLAAGGAAGSLELGEKMRTALVMVSAATADGLRLAAAAAAVAAAALGVYKLWRKDD